jgi:microcompartment protein CcmL/EutN
MAKIIARFIIEIAGKPVENVQKALEKFKEQFEKEKEHFDVVEIDLAKPEINDESNLYSGFLDMEVKFKGINKLLGFIADYTPTSVEITEPSDIKFDSAELSATLNDMSSAMLKTNIELMRYKQAAGQMYKELEILKKK